MQLTLEPLEQIDTLSVHKGGENPIRFEVPIKPNHISPASYYPMPNKLLAISDVEGNFNTVTTLLKNHRVLDHNLNWHFGNGHVVIIGDVFDRGNHVTELLWLLYRMEIQAQHKGGAVHLIIGNHEMMNLQNDLRYAEPKYHTLNTLLQQQTQWQYSDLFGPHSELGQWLRSKNTIEQIGDIIFTHGGLSPLMAEQQYSLEFINQTIRQAIDTPKKDRNDIEQHLFGRHGPMWYRGYFMSLQPNQPKITEEQLSKVLNHYQAKAIAVGHTIVDKPQSHFDGRVIAVDVKHPADHLITFPPRQSYGVLFVDGQVFIADGDGGLKEMQRL